MVSLQKHPFKVVLESTSQVEGSSSFPTVWKFQKFSAVQILREISLVSFMVCQKWYISLAKLIPRKIRVIGKFLSFHTVFRTGTFKVKYLHTEVGVFNLLHSVENLGITIMKSISWKRFIFLLTVKVICQISREVDGIFEKTWNCVVSTLWKVKNFPVFNEFQQSSTSMMDSTECLF